MKTRLARAAVQDVQDIIRILAERSPAAARGFRDKIRSARQFIGEYPDAGRKTDDVKTRYLNAAPYPYLIFYEVHAAQIVILRVMHGARDPATMPGGT